MKKSFPNLYSLSHLLESQPCIGNKSELVYLYTKHLHDSCQVLVHTRQNLLNTSKRICKSSEIYSVL